MRHEDFGHALKLGREHANQRTERSLYMRANGFHYDAEKIFCNKDGEVTRVPYIEYVPPDTTAAIFFLKNRDPARWRDAWQIEANIGKYIISDSPMTEEQWIKERAVLIGVTPSQEPEDDESKE